MRADPIRATHAWVEKAVQPFSRMSLSPRRLYCIHALTHALTCAQTQTHTRAHMTRPHACASTRSHRHTRAHANTRWGHIHARATTRTLTCTHAGSHTRIKFSIRNSKSSSKQRIGAKHTGAARWKSSLRLFPKARQYGLSTRGVTSKE